MNTSTRDNNFLWVFILLTILAVATVLRIWTIGYKSPWLDEVHSLIYARNALGHLIDIERTTDIHPPLYFILLKGWVGLFGEGREAARLFSTLLSLIGIGLLFAITRKLLGVPAALIAVGFIATFPTSVHYAREIRMYPLLTTLFLLSFLAFLQLYEDHKNGDEEGFKTGLLLPLIGFSISLALTFYTHYSAAIFFMLYTIAAIYFLLRGDKTLFLQILVGLFIATCLVLPQLNHLFSSSLGDPDKGWMEATTLRIFYSTTLGAFPYHAALKPIVLLIMVIGFVLLWARDISLGVLVFLFTAGGMLLAALIGIVEPIYLVRTIQVYTVFTGILVAVALLWMPRMIAAAVGALLLAINVYTVASEQFLPKRVSLLADDIGEMVALLDADRDQVFAKNYVQRQMRLLHVPLFDYAQVISHDQQEAGIASIREQTGRCIASAETNGCRSVILIIEKESRFNVEAIAAWNALADELKAAHQNHYEQQVAEYRVIVLSNDQDFLDRAADALQRTSN
ncbi:MAG: glycosyltransferase family 39 protein [Pseudomonadota bacterium]